MEYGARITLGYVSTKSAEDKLLESTLEYLESTAVEMFSKILSSYELVPPSEFFCGGDVPQALIHQVFDCAWTCHETPPLLCRCDEKARGVFWLQATAASSVKPVRLRSYGRPHA